MGARTGVANTLTELIIGGSLTSFEISETARETGVSERQVGKSVHNLWVMSKPIAVPACPAPSHAPLLASADATVPSQAVSQCSACSEESWSQSRSQGWTSGRRRERITDPPLLLRVIRHECPVALAAITDGGGGQPYGAQVAAVRPGRGGIGVHQPERAAQVDLVCPGETAGIWCQRRGSWRCRGRPPPTAAAPPTGRGGPDSAWEQAGRATVCKLAVAGRGAAGPAGQPGVRTARRQTSSARGAVPSIACCAVVHICSAVPAADCRNAPASDPSGGLDPAHQVRPVHVIGRQVGDGAMPLVLELHPPGPAGRGRQPRMPPGQDLQLRLLV